MTKLNPAVSQNVGNWRSTVLLPAEIVLLRPVTGSLPSAGIFLVSVHLPSEQDQGQRAELQLAPFRVRLLS